MCKTSAKFTYTVHYTVVQTVVQQWILKCVRHKMFGFYELSRHKKTLLPEYDKNFKLLIAFTFYQRTVVKQNYYMTLLLNYSNTVV